MSNNEETTQQKADKIRLEILAMSNTDLFYFAQSVYAGEVKVQCFDSVSDCVSRTAAHHIENLPF